jgi:hypothetical protein
LTAIKSAETTGILDVSGSNLHGDVAKALFKSLKGQCQSIGQGQGQGQLPHYLKELRLSECCLFDDDITVGII